MGIIELVTDCGVFGMVAIVTTAAGAVATLRIGRRVGRPGSVAAGFAAAVLSLGAIGYGLGVFAVERAVNKVAELDAAQRVVLLNMGNREAAGNLIVAGTGALLLLALGGALALTHKPRP